MALYLSSVGFHRAGGLQDLPDPGPTDALAALDDGKIYGQVAGTSGLLPYRTATDYR
ncbi:hypothetical protein D3C78_1988330 [compost metagenome]